MDLENPVHNPVVPGGSRVVPEPPSSESLPGGSGGSLPVGGEPPTGEPLDQGGTEEKVRVVPGTTRRPMTPDDRTRALTATVDQLDWLLDETYRRIWTALDILGDTRTRAIIATGSREPGARRSIGSHSDPTANRALAALEGRAAVADSDEAQGIHDHAAVVVDCARWIHITTGGPIDPEDHDLAVARLQLEWCLTIPHAIGAWRTDDDHLADELDHAVDLLHVTARKLRTTVEQTLRSSIKPRQQKRKTCANCARWGITADLEPGRYLEVCRRCGDFRAQHHFMPSEQICRVWDRGSSRITPGMVAEAKAAWKRRRKRGA